MRNILASGRGLLSGWLIAVTIPLLADPHTMAAWSGAGLGAPSRVGLASAELLGAALFAFEVPVIAGFVLLLGSFIAAAAVHIHHSEMPGWLVAYSVAVIGLLYGTLRASRAAAVGNAPAGCKSAELG